jgi:hypothetical protein
MDPGKRTRVPKSELAQEDAKENSQTEKDINRSPESLKEADTGPEDQEHKEAPCHPNRMMAVSTGSSGWQRGREKGYFLWPGSSLYPICK